MESGSSNMSVLTPPLFDGENYQAWVVRMQAYIEGCDYWEVVKEDYEVTPVLNNPTMNLIKMHKGRTNGKAKAQACLYALVSLVIFNRIIVFGSVKEIWDYFKAEYQRNERVKSMKVLNLIREFERLQMKDFESIKEYLDKLIDISNKNHLHFRCWRRLDVKCRTCNLMGYIERFCKELRNQQQGGAHVAVKEENDHLFVVSCFSSSTLCNG
ncbi:hypothetical protein CXB51_009591 [Gossypium anomalum]|uniref:DUF4219 domain-containing protein n=1 Tax=Gossypium anomalum TaxID=47600 RepID=A0A8J5YLR2_9ROSI|nr:hypothetical protein CXB51_009591 [Gossypium anomalum]